MPVTPEELREQDDKVAARADAWCDRDIDVALRAAAARIEQLERELAELVIEARRLLSQSLGEGEGEGGKDNG